MGLTVMEFARQFLNPFAIKGQEIVPTYCPVCHGGQNGDKNTFALNYENETFNCKRGSCGVQGHFVELPAVMGVNVEVTTADSERYTPKPPTYSKPKIQPKPVHEQAEKYMLLRGISKETAKAYRMGTDDSGNLLFPFYDESGNHVFNKFRHPRKLKKGERKAWREAGTKPVLFGMHLCDKNKPLTICEGEFDAMAAHESGIPNAVSVPSGTSDFTWIDTCWDFLHEFESLYLFGDNDEAGEQMISRLLAKLSDWKLYVVDHPYKDVNELLFRDGKEAVYSVWQNAEEVTPAGLIKMAEIVSLDVGNMPKMQTSISRLNQITGGMYFSNVSVITGRSGDGKSTLLSQLLLDALDGGNKVCAYSGELRADHFQYWSDLQAAGHEHIEEYLDTVSGKTVTYVPKETKKKIHTWYGDNYWLYDNNATVENEELTVLNVFETAAKRYDCRVFAIDNLMTVDFGRTSERDFFRRQSQFVDKVVKFAKLHQAHVYLVAHPRKSEGKLNKDDIGGSGDIHNRVDNVFSMERCHDGLHDSTLEVLKNRWEGVLEEIGLGFNPYCKRFFSPSDGDNKQYGWEFLDFNEVEKTEGMPW